MIAKHAGVTLRQLQVWDETGLLKAMRTGRNRIYDKPMLKEAKLIAELLSKGLSKKRDESSTN